MQTCTYVFSLQVRRWWTGWCLCSWFWPVWRPWRWPRPCWRRVSCGPSAWRVPRLSALPASASSSWTTPPRCTALWGVCTTPHWEYLHVLWADWAGRRINRKHFCVLLQSDSLKKRGSVKAESSASAVELSGKVVKRGYLLKQVSPLNRCY